MTREQEDLIKQAREAEPTPRSSDAVLLSFALLAVADAIRDAAYAISRAVRETP